MKRGVEAGEKFVVGVVTVGLEPVLCTGIDACRSLASTSEGIVSKLCIIGLVEMIARRNVFPVVLAIGSLSILRFRLIELLFECLEVECGLLFRRLFLLLKVGEVGILGDGTLRRSGFRYGGRGTGTILAL